MGQESVYLEFKSSVIIYSMMSRLGIKLIYSRKTNQQDEPGEVRGLPFMTKCAHPIQAFPHVCKKLSHQDWEKNKQLLKL